MADTKISALTTLADSALVAGDYFVVVDVSDTSMAASGTTKKIAATGVAPITGTWTPAITGSSSNPTVTYTTQVGKYTKINNICFYSFFIRINTYSGGSGNVTISLPFTAAATNSADSTIAPAYSNNVDFGGTPITILFQASSGNATGIFVATQDNGARQFLDVGGLAAGDDLQASGFFWT